MLHWIILDTLNTTIVQHSSLVLVWYGVLVSLTVIVLRIAWSFTVVYVPRLFSHRLRDRDPFPDWRTVLLVGWTGMRGVVSLAAALALPETIANGASFPERAAVIDLRNRGEINDEVLRLVEREFDLEAQRLA